MRNALLPDDEDDRWYLIHDGYQVQSDIETFEELSGIAIKPDLSLTAELEIGRHLKTGAGASDRAARYARRPKLPEP
jgi:hypothetical protein